LKTFESLGVDIAIIRHSDDRFINGLKDKFKFSVINAGAGKFEHPSQSLLDLFTIKEEFNTFDNLIVTICGDINSSRVAKSNITALGKLGVKVLLTGPEELLPKEDDLPAHCELSTLDQAVKISDVVMLLRIQHERHETFELSTEDYNDQYGLNDKRVKMMKENAIIMHPGPVNRDVEIKTHLVEHTQSRIFKQMENGVYTRMAILDWIYS
jgi:aspartate carbamoyltransferase catalytic subunit